MRFQSERSVFKFLRCSADGKHLMRRFRVKSPFSNSSCVEYMWTGSTQVSKVYNVFTIVSFVMWQYLISTDFEWGFHCLFLVVFVSHSCYILVTLSLWFVTKRYRQMAYRLYAMQASSRRSVSQGAAFDSSHRPFYFFARCFPRCALTNWTSNNWTPGRGLCNASLVKTLDPHICWSTGELLEQRGGKGSGLWKGG